MRVEVFGSDCKNDIFSFVEMLKRGNVEDRN